MRGPPIRGRPKTNQILLILPSLLQKTASPKNAPKMVLMKAGPTGKGPNNPKISRWRANHRPELSKLAARIKSKKPRKNKLGQSRNKTLSIRNPVAKKPALPSLNDSENRSCSPKGLISSLLQLLTPFKRNIQSSLVIAVSSFFRTADDAK